MLEVLLTAGFLAQTLRITVPYVLPALGATFSERSGVVNIALEGCMLVAAFATTLGTYYTGNPAAGILFGIAGGVLVAAAHGIITITIKANQIVSGIAFNLLALGLTKFCCKIVFHSSSNSARIPGLESWPRVPGIPLFDNPLVLLTILLVPSAHWILFHTVFGLRLRAAGEHPAAVFSLGVSVQRLRWWGLLMSGVLSGLAGAWLALEQHSFTDGMTAGRGFIALAAMIVGKWNPYGAALAALLFGFAESLALTLQTGSEFFQFIQMLPYLITIVVLAGFIGKALPPRAVGVPFHAEEH